MLIPASFNPTDLSGLSPTVSIVLLVLAAIALAGIIAIGWFLVSEASMMRGLQEDRFAIAPGPVDRGTALPCWCNEDALKGVAKQHQVDGTPAKVEKSKGFGLSFGIPFGGAKGKADGSSKVTHEPYDDLGDLIFRVLARLDNEEVLNQSADCIHMPGGQIDPVFAALSGGQEEAKEFFQQWLDKHFPEGLQAATSEELATKLAGISDELREEDLREWLRNAHRALSNNDGSILLLEGEWKVVGEEGDLLLERTDLRIMAYDDTDPKSLPMPSGISIHVRLDGEMTRHGKNSMVGVTRPVRGCVMGTVRQHEPTTGCLEIVPIAVSSEPRPAQPVSNYAALYDRHGDAGTSLCAVPEHGVAQDRSAIADQTTVSVSRAPFPWRSRGHGAAAGSPRRRIPPPQRREGLGQGHAHPQSNQTRDCGQRRPLHPTSTRRTTVGTRVH